METYTKLNPKPVNFKFGEYINQGFELFKQKPGDFILASLCAMVLSIIPLCGFMAVGNLMKYFRRFKNGENPSPGEIFNFDDFMPYLVLNLILIGVVFLVYIPMFPVIFAAGRSGSETVSTVFGAFFPIYILAILVLVYYLMARAFYLTGLISLAKVHDLKTAWNITSIMTKGNILMIILFAIVTSLIGQIGIILCVIGIVVTMPIYYAMMYFAQEDGLAQIDGNEINEIGNSQF